MWSCMPPNPQLIGHFFHSRPVVNSSKQISSRQPTKGKSSDNKPTADARSSAMYSCTEQILFLSLSLRVLLCWLAFLCSTAAFSAHFCLWNVKQVHDYCDLHAKWTFYAENVERPGTMGGLHMIRKDFVAADWRKRHEKQKCDCAGCLSFHNPVHKRLFDCKQMRGFRTTPSRNCQ